MIEAKLVCFCFRMCLLVSMISPANLSSLRQDRICIAYHGVLIKFIHSFITIIVSLMVFTLIEHLAKMQFILVQATLARNIFVLML